MNDDQQLHRAVANVLWPFLRARDAGWAAYREERVISPTGNPSTGRYSSAHSPNPNQSNIELISITYKTITTLWSEDWPGATSWRIRRHRNYEDAAIARLNAATIADYESALEHATCRKPFQTATDENGNKRLTRNRNDGTITNLAAAALEAIAKACELERIPQHIEEALLTDGDINLDEILAARQRAGALKP